MVEHRHRLTASQKKWLTERELRGEVAKPTVAARAVWPLASDRVGYWELEALGLEMEEIRNAMDKVDAAATELGAGGEDKPGVGGTRFVRRF